MSLPILSHSEVDTWLLCQRRHYYAFGEKLVRKSGMSDSLIRGISGHAMLAAYFSATGLHSARLQAAVNEGVKQMAEYKSINAAPVAEAYQLAMGFLTFHGDRISGWRIEGVEEESRLEFPDFIYAFTVDLDVWDTDGKRKFVDWKFTYDAYDSDFMSIAPQLPRYIGAARALGANIRDGMYGFVRYRKLNSDTDKYVLAPIHVTTPRIQNAFRDLVTASEDILSRKALELEEWKTKVSRVTNQTVCRSCSFKSLCAVEANGGDGKLERKYNYAPNTRYGYVEEE